MEESSLSMLWDALTCSTCLDILKHPVSLQCGHSFCLTCITDSWDQEGVCRCPHCRKTFTQRPDLCINIHLANAVEKLYMASQSRAGPDDIECSFCSEIKLKAVKSCLTCFASYCEIHLQPHYKINTLKNHKLVNPTRNIENYMCSEHQKALELFCTDHCVCICSSCVADKHKNHHTVLPEKERANKKVRATVRWALPGFLLLTSRFPLLFACSLSEYISLLSRKINQNVQTNSRKKPNLNLLSSSLMLYSFKEIVIQILNKVNSVKTTEECISPFFANFVFSYSQLDSCQLTLDPNTAYERLYLSEENTKVSRSLEAHFYSEHPDRFEFWDQVLCKEGLSGTRCYWEVEWSGAAEIGVTYKKIKRKGMEQDSRLGYNKKSWTLCCSSYTYSVWHNNKETELRAPTCTTIGVYLDFPAGTLSFYSISDSMILLHKFKTTFTEPLYPGFCLKDQTLLICAGENHANQTAPTLFIHKPWLLCKSVHFL
uniref:Tripartite motif-containing protein 16-like n=1 Tax=Erpetoichthys calabaricus TaxID=27687 RepID=A0A8C4T1B0_ERPCA